MIFNCMELGPVIYPRKSGSLLEDDLDIEQRRAESL